MVLSSGGAVGPAPPHPGPGGPAQQGAGPGLREAGRPPRTPPGHRPGLTGPPAGVHHHHPPPARSPGEHPHR